MEKLRQPIQFVRGVGPRRAESLGKFGIATVEDLIYHLPFRYEDRRRVERIRDAPLGEKVTVAGALCDLVERRVGRGDRKILQGTLRDDTGLLRLTWFHHTRYIRKRYPPGRRYRVYGKIESVPDGAKRITHPEMEAETSRIPPAIRPVYGKPTRIAQTTMRKLVHQALRDHLDTIPSVLPAAVAREAGVGDLAAAFRAVHVPPPGADFEDLNRFTSAAHRSLVFDELFLLQLAMLMKHRAVAQESAVALPSGKGLAASVTTRLPFELTAAQYRAIGEIQTDMARPHPMLRLLQGDVGSGKTIVAFIAALTAIENGRQVAFLAPTEILAEQHFHTVSQLAGGLGVEAVLLTGGMAARERENIYRRIADGDIALAVGTHALIQEGVRFRSLGLGVIDEQHRFGVRQRESLRDIGRRVECKAVPHTLLMSATPIPRTLAMTVYGDLDISLLDETPPGRKRVRTIVLPSRERRRAYALARRFLDDGAQGYVVYPLVESSEREDLRDATSMAKELARTVFPDFRVGLVHGRMKAAEVDAVMRAFAAGDVKLLVATTVIEVGLDVPNAAFMIVEHAERFGLAQLHQLRGRVGRRTQEALCVLVTGAEPDTDGHRRLDVLAHEHDGFVVAEKDLEFRGPGELLGRRQSGFPNLRVANLVRDSRILVDARRMAAAWLAQDPSLERDESCRLRAVLWHRWGDRYLDSTGGGTDRAGAIAPAG